MASESSGPTIRRRTLGRVLRLAREAKGLGRKAAAEAADYSESGLSRVEKGTLGIKVGQLRMFMDLYGIADPEQRAELEKLSREGRQRSWWSSQRSELQPGYATYIGLEDEAFSVREYQAKSIPGLLQTERYMRAMAQAAIPPMRDETIDARVKVKMQRQQILHRDQPPALHVVLDEGALRRRVGGEDVWREQMSHLIECSSWHNVVVQILPFEMGAYAGALGGFVELTVPEFPPSVYIELDSSDLLLEGQDAAGYTLLFENLRTQALGASLSVELIRRVADEGR